MRSGEFVKQVGGYEAFVPKPLPPMPPIQMDSQMASLLSEADRALGRLDGVTSILPNPDFFVAMYVRHTEPWMVLDRSARHLESRYARCEMSAAPDAPGLDQLMTHSAWGHR